MCAPERWGRGPDGTLDGCVPVRIVWARFHSLTMHRAIDVTDTVRGIGLALGSGADSDRARREVFEQAFPDPED